MSLEAEEQKRGQQQTEDDAWQKIQNSANGQQLTE